MYKLTYFFKNFNLFIDNLKEFTSYKLYKNLDISFIHK
jgi:hypothetical protein